MYFDSTYLLLLPGLLLGLWAQSQVKGAYEQYSRVGTRLNESASVVVQDLLQRNGNGDVAVGRISGQMTDHYDPRTRMLNLSEGVYDSTSVAALGIAAHEAGHAMQHQEGYAMLKLRSAIVPVVNFGSGAAMPIFILGLAFAWRPLTTIGILLFSLSVLFSLITLPVEFDASRRALQMLTAGGYVTAEEEAGVRKVLRAAAMTYVAAAIASLMSLLRLVLLSNRRSRR